MSVCIVHVPKDKSLINGKVLTASRRRVVLYHSPPSRNLPLLSDTEGSYAILPISLNSLSSERSTPRKFAISLHTSVDVTDVWSSTVSAKEIGYVIALACKRFGKRQEPFSKMGMYLYDVRT